jgi:RNase adaptor protein for sRNA GlmZ degradation
MTKLIIVDEENHRIYGGYPVEQYEISRMFEEAPIAYMTDCRPNYVSDRTLQFKASLKEMSTIVLDDETMKLIARYNLKQRNAQLVKENRKIQADINRGSCEIISLNAHKTRLKREIIEFKDFICKTSKEYPELLESFINFIHANEEKD